MLVYCCRTWTRVVIFLQILKRARESVQAGPEAFARRLRSALERVQLSSVLLWLKEQLDEWEGWVTQTVLVLFTEFWCGG